MGRATKSAVGESELCPQLRHTACSDQCHDPIDLLPEKVDRAKAPASPPRRDAIERRTADKDRVSTERKRLDDIDPRRKPLSTMTAMRLPTAATTSGSASSGGIEPSSSRPP